MGFAGLKEQLNGDWILLKCATIMKGVSKTGYFILMEHNTVRYGKVTCSHAAVRPNSLLQTQSDILLAAQSQLNRCGFSSLAQSLLYVPPR